MKFVLMTMNCVSKTRNFVSKTRDFVLKMIHLNRFEGKWKHGEMHGEGVYTYANGDMIAATFRHLSIKGDGEYSWLRQTLDQDVAPVRHTITGKWALESHDHVIGRVDFEDTGDWYIGGWDRGKRTPNTKGSMRVTSTDR